MCNSVPFHVPITLSVHISLGVRYSPVSLTVPVTQYGVSYFRFLLHRTDPHLSVRTFLYGKHLDPYIRGFRQSVVDNSHHRYFVDSRRVICIQYLYRTFVSRVATLLRQTSADFIELQTPAFTAGAGRSIREGISGRYPVILPFELSVLLIPYGISPTFLASHGHKSMKCYPHRAMFVRQRVAPKMFSTSREESRSLTFCVMPVGIPPHLRKRFQISTV